MDWNLAGFHQETISSIDMVRKTSSFGAQEIKGDYSVDLKLGRVISEKNELFDSTKVRGVSKMALSNSVSFKRGRAVNNGSPTASCLVDGCKADLSNCRDYHRRHKVCELHSKTAQVTINGDKRRFCQQCSRFHSLDEFDEGKRSCRKRLDGHNRRRRKSQPEPLPRTGSIMSTYEETGLLPSYNSTGYPTTAVATQIWTGVIKADEESELYPPMSQWQLQSKSNSDAAGKKPSSFSDSSANLALNNQTTCEAFSGEPFLKMATSSDCGPGGDCLTMFCHELPTQILESDCALSLLSSPTGTSAIGLSNGMQRNSILTPPHPLVAGGLHYSNLEAVEFILAPDAAAGASVHCQEMFRTGPDVVPSANGTPPTPSFYWEQ